MDLDRSCGRPAPVGVGPSRCGRHPVATMLIALPLMLATSCSTLGPNIAAADEVAVDFHRSIQDSDGGAACALLAPATVEEVESTGGTSCPDAILDRIPMWQRAMKAFMVWLKTDPPQTIAPLVGVAHQSKIRGSNGGNFGFLIPRHIGVLQRGSP